jgi:hypothetical protein
MFCTPALAARIDRAEGRLCAAMAKGFAASQPEIDMLLCSIGGGIAVYAGPESPANKLIGAGFDGSVEAASLAQVEAEFARRNARLQAEVSTLADPSFHACLCARGYLSSGFENVLGFPLTPNLSPTLTGVSVKSITPGESELLADVLVDAFSHPDTGGVGGDAIPPSDLIRRLTIISMGLPGFKGYLARVNGEVAGAASLRFDEGIAQFSGAGTLPRFRRRGVQTALLRARLADAGRDGCDLGVVVTQPASKSQQNVQREDFALLYTRQLLVKNPQ